MKLWFEQLRQRVAEIRTQEAAQRDFLRAVYEAPRRLPADYERPAYLRKARAMACACR